jgi:LuxR family maltose regulon positive regulatory protein
MAGTRDDLIQTKLTRPSLPLGLVPRPRLQRRLEEHAGRVILISAPAGFGKTALILEWLERREGPVAWLSLDRLDNDPTRFFGHLSAALADLPLVGAEEAASLLRTIPHRSGSMPDVEQAFAALGRDAVLVVDDVHELEERSTLSGLELLIQGAGPGPRLVLLTRSDPPFLLGRLRVNGDLLEIREDDLRFTSDECNALFEDACPGGLDATLVNKLMLRTEGWPAGCGWPRSPCET